MATRKSPKAQLPLAESHGHLVRQAHKTFTRELEKVIEKEGVPIGNWYFLRALWEEGEVSQADLAARLAVKGPTTVSALAKMESLGLVERRQDDDDRRKVIVTLTEKGQKLEEKLMPAAIGVVDKAMNDFTPDERAQLRDFLKRLIANLSD